MFAANLSQLPLRNWYSGSRKRKSEFLSSLALSICLVPEKLLAVTSAQENPRRS